MFVIFFKIAIRNLRKNKSFSLINLFGLSVGIAAFLLIALYIKDELNYDTFLKDADRIYQVNISGNFGGEEIEGAITPPPVGAALMEDFQGIESYTRIFQPGDVMISYKKDDIASKYFTESQVLAVDSNFLDIFRFEALHGNSSDALSAPHTIVLTEEMAQKYFNSIDVVGQFLLYGNEKVPYKVTSVLKNIPAQSSLQFDFLVPMQTYSVVEYFNWSWIWLNVNTYVKVSESLAANPQTIQKIASQTPEMVKRRAAKAFARVGMPMDEFYKNGGHWDFYLQPYTNVHLHSAGIYNGLLQLGNIRTLYIFGIIAAFIVLLACVNFMNLSTAKSFNRARETGVRKVMGSSQKSLVIQFLSESILFSTLATLLACLLVKISLPLFNSLAVKQLSFNALFTDYFWIGIAAIALLTGLMAGSYPAFYLSAFRPVEVLKGGFITKGGNALIRNGLVVFQFVVSVALIICTIVVYNQLRYTQEKDLGLDQDNVLILSNTQRLEEQEETFRQEISNLSGVAAASISTNVPTGGAFGDRYIPVKAEGQELLVEDIALYSYMSDENFLPALDIQLATGRNFSKEFSDSASVILNETAVRQIGWENPIGQYLLYPGGDYTRYKVIGVVEDFNVESLHEVVRPFALFHHSSQTYQLPESFIIVKIESGQIRSTIAALESKWKGFVRDKPLDYNFLDARIAGLYKSEQQIGRVFIAFASLAIFIACLGLFGLAAFMAEQRTKEIGIRKVLGASVEHIVTILSKDFIRLVLLATLLAIPLAWWSMSRWLEVFAYRIQLQWWMFVLAGAAAIGIALFTVSFQAIRAAVSNPVESLRSE